MENNNIPIYKRPVDEYLPCTEYNGEEGFIKFFKEDEKRYYFAFNGPTGKTYLRSQGYQNEPGRDNGIDSVLRNAPLDERWFDGFDEEEKYYYYGLKAGNRQEIARSCRYESKEEMEKDFAWVRGEESSIGKGSKEIDGVWYSAAALAEKDKNNSNGNIDEYLPCEEYKGEEGFYKFKKEDEYYFAYNGEDGNTYLRSEGYTNEAGRDNGIDSVIRNAKLDERWVKGFDEEGNYYYYALKAGNRQEIAKSCEYESEEKMLAAFAYVRGEKSLIGSGSKLVGGALMSAAMLSAAETPKTIELEKVEEPKAPHVAEAAVPPVETEDKKGCGRWWIWLLLIALLIILCLIFCKGCDETNKIVETPKAAVEKITETATAAGEAVKDAADKTVEGAGKVVESAGNLTNNTAEKLEAALTSGNSFVLEGLNFAYNSNNLTPESQLKLKEIVVVLKKHGDIKVEIQGHTDNVGNDSFNKTLSQKRANSIKSYLVQNGIASSRLVAKGYGERNPVASNNTEDGRAKNRRIEFKVIK